MYALVEHEAPDWDVLQGYQAIELMHHVVMDMEEDDFTPEHEELVNLHLIFKAELQKVVDWSKVDKEDYLLAMERSPIKDIEIKHILKGALTDEINSREVYRKGIDHSYYYEGYTIFKTEEL